MFSQLCWSPSFCRDWWSPSNRVFISTLVSVIPHRNNAIAFRDSFDSSPDPALLLFKLLAPLTVPPKYNNEESPFFRDVLCCLQHYNIFKKIRSALTECKVVRPFYGFDAVRNNVNNSAIKPFIYRFSNIQRVYCLPSRGWSTEIYQPERIRAYP